MKDRPTCRRGIADLGPLDQAREQKAWYWYDWANSAYVTTIATVLFAPVPHRGRRGAPRSTTGISVLGLSVAPGSLPSYLVTALHDPLGAAPAAARRDGRPHREARSSCSAGFAWTGAAFAVAAVLLRRRQLAARRGRPSSAPTCASAASMVVNDSILPLISDEAERDRVSSRGWAFGYLGGGLLLAVNFGRRHAPATLRARPTGMAVRICMLSAAIWWAGFTIIPFVRLSNHPPGRRRARRRAASSRAASASSRRRCGTCATTRWR